MRSALLLVGYLAVLPFISATAIVPSVQVGNKIYNYKGCRAYPSLGNEMTMTDPITVEDCLAKCSAHNFPDGGVRKQRCFCDNSDIGYHLEDLTCMQDYYVCKGNTEEYCGSSAALVLYELQVISA